MPTVEQCQRALSALEKIWESLPRSERNERKEEREHIRAILLAAASTPQPRPPQPRTDSQGARSAQAGPAQARTDGGSNHGDPRGYEPSTEEDEDLSRVEMAMGALLDLSEEEWEEIQILMSMKKLSDRGRAEMLFVASQLNCTDCGAEYTPEELGDEKKHVCSEEEGEDDEDGEDGGGEAGEESGAAIAALDDGEPL